MKNILKVVLGSAAALCALVPASHGQTVFNAAGSSALFLELGEAAYTSNLGPGIGVCIWSGTSGVTMTDTSTGSSKTDSGSAWVVWVRAVGKGCTSNATPQKVFAYLQTDSVVGNRCLFNSQASNSCSVSYAAAVGSSPANLIGSQLPTPVAEYALPALVASALTNAKVNVAGTDIRPEDAAFATLRALTPCGSSTPLTGGSIAPYLGLGYSNGDDILSAVSSKKFHAISFTLPSTYFVQPVGFDPMMVVINSTDASGTGFNNSAITNVSRAALALYLDGSIGTTDAMVPVGTTNTPAPVTVFVREPLSGTYNTMEYNVPNTVMMGTSQDVGARQLPSQMNCSGTVPGSNPMDITNTTAGSVRKRAIGTGEELAQTFATNDALGYGFWGISNFAAAPATARYLKVDGYDPIRGSYTGGVIPTACGTGFSGITFGQIANGNYPIWSLIRLVTVDSGTAALAKTLAIGAAGYSGGSHPDFLTYYTSKGVPRVGIERSHFAPPGITFSSNNIPANGGVAYPSGVGDCTTPERGGDVGGVILNIAQTDQVYCTETGLATGITGRRN